MPTKIDRLYKYGRLNEHSEALFSSGEVFFSAPSQLNDPFECRPRFTFDGTQKQIVNAAITMLLRHPNFATRDAATTEAERLWREGRLSDRARWEAVARDLHRDAQSVGLYCLSQDRTSILMWSHYADNHKGYCLEFAATDHTPLFGAAQPVDYCDNHPVVDFFSMSNEKQVELVFLTKFKSWDYEQEWRIIDYRAGPGLRPYPSKLLMGIIFGLRMSDEDKAQIREWIGRRGHPIRLHQTLQRERKFSIEIEEIAS